MNKIRVIKNIISIFINMAGSDTKGWAFQPNVWAFYPLMGQGAHFGIK